MKIKIFTDGDWSGWSGAEEFIDGSRPLVAYIRPPAGWPADDVKELAFQCGKAMKNTITVIADRRGLTINGADVWLGCLTPDNYELPLLLWNQKVARKVMPELEGKSFNELQSSKYGFTWNH